MRQINPSHVYYHADGNGNVTTLVDDQQRIAAQYIYDSYGNLVSMSGIMAEQNPYRFSSKEYHAASGLYYYGYRFYDPNFQRWLNRDPIGEKDSINLYRFCYNNSIVYFDLYGLEVGFWEGLIPVWGSGKQAYQDFRCGKWFWGSLNTLVAISDVVPIRAAIGAAGKGVWKAGSHTWGATSKWLTKTGWREYKDQEVHHWAIPQNTWGSNVPEWFKNQPWNLMPTPNDLFHDALHGVGENSFNFAERLWYGTPKSLKAGASQLLVKKPIGSLTNEIMKRKIPNKQLLKMCSTS
jgi:RHS repeat-associated protein